MPARRRRAGLEAGTQRGARGAAARRPAPAAPPDEVAPESAATRAALVLAAGLALLAALRAALPFAPGMAAWSLNLQRFLPPLAAWLPWLVAALALVPAVGRALERPLAAAGDAIAARPGRAMLAAALLAAIAVWALPDRTRFVGDFLVRQGTVEVGIVPQRVWPQALPLDALLHFSLPAWLAARADWDANLSARLLDALEAAALGALCVAFAREQGLRGAAAVAAGAVALFGGALSLFTGYGKAFTELVVATVAIGWLGLRMVRRGEGALALGAVLAVALSLHRSAPAFLPAAAFAFTLGAPRTAGRRPPGWTPGLVLPVAALAIAAPKIVSLLGGYDRVHYASEEVRRHGGLLGSMFAGARGWDLASVVLLLAPLAPVAAGIALALGPAVPRRREALFLGLLVAPWLGLMLVIHPTNGLARDYDVFAASGAALSLLAAWLVGETLRAAPRRAWLAAATALAVAAPTLQWMAIHADPARGLARVEALMHSAPAREEEERGRTWDFLGTRWHQLEKHEASARAWREAVRWSPSARILQQLALAETLCENLPGAVDAYHRSLEKDPSNWSAWFGLAAVTSRIPDYPECRRALARLLEMRPGDPDVTALVEQLDREEAVWTAGHAAAGNAKGQP